MKGFANNQIQSVSQYCLIKGKLQMIKEIIAFLYQQQIWVKGIKLITEFPPESHYLPQMVLFESQFFRNNSFP